MTYVIGGIIGAILALLVISASVQQIRYQRILPQDYAQER